MTDLVIAMRAAIQNFGKFLWHSTNTSEPPASHGLFYFSQLTINTIALWSLE